MAVEQSLDEPEPVVRIREIEAKIQQAVEAETDVDDADVEAFESAIEALSLLGQAARPAVPTLLRLLNIFSSKEAYDAHLAEEIIRVLTAVANAEDQNVVDALLQLVENHADEELRKAAHDALKVASRNVVAALRSLEKAAAQPALPTLLRLLKIFGSSEFSGLAFETCDSDLALDIIEVMGPAAEPALLLAIHAAHAEGVPGYDFFCALWDRLKQTRNPETVRAILACEDRSGYWAEVLDQLDWTDPGLATLRPLAVDTLVQAMLEVEVDQDTAEGAAASLLCSEPLRVALCLIDTGGDRTATGSALRCVACEYGLGYVIEPLAAVQFDLPPGAVVTPDYFAGCLLDELELLHDREGCEGWFVPMLENREPANRAFAACALANAGVVKALPDLTRHQNDPDERVRDAISFALAWTQEFWGATDSPQPGL